MSEQQSKYGATPEQTAKTAQGNPGTKAPEEKKPEPPKKST